MEAVSSPGFWWLKVDKTASDAPKPVNITSTPRHSDDPSTISSSLREFLERERTLQNAGDVDTDIGSIIEEINRLAAESPLGPYEVSGERTIEEIMREAEKVYMESSKSFEQLSARSKTSANLSVSLNESLKSTSTPKSASPLPLDSDKLTQANEEASKCESYTEDFTQEDASEAQKKGDEKSEGQQVVVNETYVEDKDGEEKIGFDDESENNSVFPLVNNGNVPLKDVSSASSVQSQMQKDLNKNLESIQAIKTLEKENRQLLDNIAFLKIQLEETNNFLQKTKADLSAKSLKSPENLELQRLIEEVKDARETNTALQLQLDSLNQTHQQLRVSYDELLTSNRNLEKRLLDSEGSLSKYKEELQDLQAQRGKLTASEAQLTKLLEIEKLQTKSLKVQTEKDARYIQDLNRQVKEMERIIARKHPDSVSSLIVAAKNDQAENSLTARKLLEDRIKSLESEFVARDQQSSKVFLEVQEKFTEMKNKYESHIEDLELHVNDLKDQLKRRVDTFDVYTQTFFDEQKPIKEGKDIAVQTVNTMRHQMLQKKKLEKTIDSKEDAHLLATIRGLQADLVNKEKMVSKLQKELDEVQKTNKRLQKEREGNLKNIAERREFHSYPEKLASQLKTNSFSATLELENELRTMRLERDKMRMQLCKIEEDYQNLKTKRLFDLSALQQAHEQEISTYVANITPLQEQLELHQLTIKNLQDQLRLAKEQLEIVTAERDELYNRLHNESAQSLHLFNANDNAGIEDLQDLPLHKKLAIMERRYQEREQRLRAIVHGLAQKNVMNLSCQQCTARQQQLILYKAELDQLLATLRTLT